MSATFAIVPVEACQDPRLSKMQLRVLIALLSFRAKNTDTIWPKRQALSELCGYTERNISKTTSDLVKLGWLQKEGKGGYSNSCKYRVTVPELDTVNGTETVLGTDTVDEAPEAPDSGDGIEATTVSGSETVPEQKTVSESDTSTVPGSDRGKEQTIEHTKVGPSQVSGEKFNGKYKSPVSIDRFISDCKAASVQMFPSDCAALRYADDAQIPPDFLMLCWAEFKDRCRTSKKKQKDWRATFLNCVRGNWYGLWFLDENKNYQLTTKGKQAEIAMGAKAA